ncbi:transposase, IS91 family domain protein, partial [Candidatus Erwinia dacicola]
MLRHARKLGIYEALQMQTRKKPGFAVLMKGFLGTDPYKYILCGDWLRFAGAQAGTQAMELLSERLREMEKKRWLR